MHREVEHLVSQFSKHSWPNHHFWISCRDGICCGAELVDLWFIYHYLSIIIYLLSLTFYLFFCALGKKKRGTCGCKLKARDFAGILFKWEGNFKLNRFFFFLFFFSFFLKKTAVTVYYFKLVDTNGSHLKLLIGMTDSTALKYRVCSRGFENDAKI